MEYHAKNPYPIPRVEKENREYGYLLLQDYAGEVSEDTAIHLYFYQYFIKQNKDPELAEALKKIAIVEMHHLELLGETILLLGVDPKYRIKGTPFQQDIFWNASYVNYEQRTKALLEVNMASERKAIQNYMLHRKIIKDPYIQQLLTRIIEDEEVHLKIFKYFYEKYNF